MVDDILHPMFNIDDAPPAPFFVGREIPITCCITETEMRPLLAVRGDAITPLPPTSLGEGYKFIYSVWHFRTSSSTICSESELDVDYEWVLVRLWARRLPRARGVCSSIIDWLIDWLICSWKKLFGSDLVKRFAKLCVCAIWKNPTGFRDIPLLGSENANRWTDGCPGWGDNPLPPISLGGRGGG